MIAPVEKTKLEIQKFLRNNGWIEHRSKDGFLTRFQKKDSSLDEPVSIFFATFETDEERMRAEIDDAKATLRQYYGVNIEANLDRAVAFERSGSGSFQPFDAIISRISDQYVTADSIEMTVALDALNFLRGTINDTAEAIVHGDHFLAPTEAAKLRSIPKSCRLGHTFRGSFGLSVELPMESDPQMSFDLFETHTPMVREITQRIYRGFSNVAAAVSDMDAEALIESSHSFSGRTCGRLADYLHASGMNCLLFAVRFDHRIGTPPDRTYTEFSVPATAKVIDLLNNAASILDEPTLLENELVIGRVVSLRSDLPPADQLEACRVAVRWDASEGTRTVHFSLPPVDYTEAIAAHREGFFVMFRARIERRRTRWNAYDVTEFKIIQ